MAVLYEEAFVQTFEYIIKATYHLGGKVDELIENFSVVLFEMGPLHLKDVVLIELQFV